MSPAPARQDTWQIKLNIKQPDGTVIDLGVWDTMSGGEIDSDESKYRPGGMAPQLSLGGFTDVGELKLGRYYDIERDHPLVKTLASLVGIGKVSAGATPLGPDGRVLGDPIVRNGILKTLTLPEVDSTSTDAAIIELAVTCDGAVA